MCSSILSSKSISLLLYPLILHLCLETILLLLCPNNLIIARDRKKSDSLFSIFPICPYFEAEQHIAMAIKITITTTSKMGCVNSHSIANSNRKNPTTFPITASPEKSPLVAAIIEATTNIKITAKICIHATSIRHIPLFNVTFLPCPLLLPL